MQINVANRNFDVQDKNKQAKKHYFIIIFVLIIKTFQSEAHGITVVLDVRLVRPSSWYCITQKVCRFMSLLCKCKDCQIQLGRDCRIVRTLYFVEMLNFQKLVACKRLDLGENQLGWLVGKQQSTKYSEKSLGEVGVFLAKPQVDKVIDISRESDEIILLRYQFTGLLFQ